MFDNLRDETSSFSDEPASTLRPTSSTVSGPITSSRKSRRFLGMTSMQRFVIAMLFMSTVCVLGLMFLFINGKIGF
jgi:hypothetical protein